MCEYVNVRMQENTGMCKRKNVANGRPMGAPTGKKKRKGTTVLGEQKERNKKRNKK